MANPETVLQQEIRLAVTKQCPGVRLFRNQVGAAKVKGTWLKYGLTTGSPDLVGWQSLVVDESMVGERIAVFVGMEIKTDTGELRDDQKKFLAALDVAGGVSCVVRSVERAVEVLTKD